MTSAPIIDTGSIRLRPYRMSDLEPLWEFFQSPRAAYVDGPANRTHLWYGFASEAGSWGLLGQGGWSIETADGALAGQVAVTQPPRFPEREIGWILFDGFEGRGIAYAAAKAARDWAFESIEGCDTLVSYITPQNVRSIALAKRLGATHDPQAALPEGETAAETVVYRHRRAA